MWISNQSLIKEQGLDHIVSNFTSTKFEVMTLKMKMQKNKEKELKQLKTMKNTQICPVSGCKFDKAWGIVKDNKVYRITFSKSLVDLILKDLQGDYRVARLSIQLGDKIDDIDSSKAKIFAICKSKTKWPLRVTMFREAAKLWEDKGVRDIYSCNIKIIK